MKKQRLPEKVGAIVRSVLRESGYLSICLEQDVLTKWPLIVGTALANVTECRRVEGGILYVRVPAAPWRQEISYLKETLLQKIRSETSCTTIRDIVFF